MSSPRCQLSSTLYRLVRLRNQQLVLSLRGVPVSPFLPSFFSSPRSSPAARATSRGYPYEPPYPAAQELSCKRVTPITKSYMSTSGEAIHGKSNHLYPLISSIKGVSVLFFASPDHKMVAHQQMYLPTLLKSFIQPRRQPSARIRIGSQLYLSPFLLHLPNHH